MKSSVKWLSGNMVFGFWCFMVQAGDKYTYRFLTGVLFKDDDTWSYGLHIGKSRPDCGVQRERERERNNLKGNGYLVCSWKTRSMIDVFLCHSMATTLHNSKSY